MAARRDLALDFVQSQGQTERRSERIKAGFTAMNDFPQKTHKISSSCASLCKGVKVKVIWVGSKQKVHPCCWLTSPSAAVWSDKRLVHGTEIDPLSLCLSLWIKEAANTISNANVNSFSTPRWRSGSWTTTTTCRCSLMAYVRLLIRTRSSPARESMTCWTAAAPRSCLSSLSSSCPSGVSLGRGAALTVYQSHTSQLISPVTPCGLIIVFTFTVLSSY